MRRFTNISMEAIAKLLGVSLEGRRAEIKKDDKALQRFLNIPIKLFLLLNFYANSNTGTTTLLSLNELAKRLKCHVKTIYSALRKLAANDMITYMENAETGYVNVIILHLQDMYKRRGEGGKGYITFNTELLETLLSAKDINVLRAMLISLLETSTRIALSASKSLKEIQVSFSTLATAFPKSARPKDIRMACDKKGVFGELFDRASNDLRKTIFVKLKEGFDGKFVKQQVRLEAKKNIISEINAINEAVRNINTGIHEDGIVHINDARVLLDEHDIDLFKTIDVVHPDKSLPLLDLNSDERNDCTTIAQDYGIDTVITAIRVFYENYLMPGNFKIDKTKSIGGLIRRIVGELFGQADLLTNPS